MSLWHKFQQNGNVRDLPRQSRGRVTTLCDDRYIRLSHLRDRFRSATVTARNTVGAHGHHISDQTVRNRLRTAGIRPHRPYVGPILTARHRRARLAWARAHLRWRRNDWASALFTDESRFNLRRSDGRARVYRRQGEHFHDACVVENDRFGGGSVMIWGGISLQHKTEVRVIDGNLNAQRYQTEVLAPVVVPFIRTHPHMILMQDNATSHSARATRQYLSANNVQVMDWPARSPDLNPIEHVWDLLDRRLRNARNPPQTVAALRQEVVRQWNLLAQNEIRRYIGSMRRRCQAVIQAEGGHTRY